jgi:hypothetical protein
MTHGPIPRKAIDEAWLAASRRGPVLDTSGLSRLPCDLLLFTGTQVIFIRVKRIRTHASDPEEIGRLFRDAVRELRSVPVQPAVCREIHILTPWGVWQYFRIDPEGIVEIRTSGLPGIAGVPDTPREMPATFTKNVVIIPESVTYPPGPVEGDIVPGVSRK